jgi:aryl-alcohol dehydrogenase
MVLDDTGMMIGEEPLLIQAAVLRRPGRPLEIETLELDGPRDDEILVRIVATGVCHTDIGFCDTWNEADGPVVLGHEGAGIVQKVGRKVNGLQEGDHVVLSYQSCGICSECRGGHPWACHRFREANFGFARLDGTNGLHRSGVKGHFFGQSSFATSCLVTERNAVKVPMDIQLEMLGPLGCGIQTGAGTVMNSLSVRSGDSIAVFGTGSVGMAAVMAAKVVGASVIIGVDINQRRLDLAKELGVTKAVNARRSDIMSAFGATRVSYAVDTTGDPQVMRLAVELLKPGGVAALLTGADSPVEPKEGRRSIQVIQGDAVPQLFIPKLIDFYRAGQFPFDRLIKFYGFEDINTAIADSRRGDTVKPVLTMPEIPI